MAKFFKSEKWKKRLTAGLAVALSATLTLGVLSACGKTKGGDDDEDDTPVLPTDTQLIKNGDFEFYNEMTKEETDKKRAFINSPTSWTSSSESPTSNTSSGIVNSKDWTYMTKSAFSLIREEDRYTENDDGEKEKVKAGDATLTSEAISYATEHWDEASLYDRLEFYDFFKVDKDSGFDLYDDYKYSIDFEDVQYLAEEAGEELTLHYTDEDKAEAEKNGETLGSNVLMIHNHRYSETDKVSGTGKYYTSSTQVTLNAGTAAIVTVWAKTLNLTHYNKVDVTRRGGAYISVTNNVGSSTLDQVQINDIITTNAEDQESHNGWQQFTVYIRANSFASTTFRIVLGLGRSSSDDRYEAVDGIALFDDLKCELIEDSAFHSAVYGEAKVVSENHLALLDDKGDDRKFYSTNRQTGVYDEDTVYALDLKATFERFNFNTNELGDSRGDIDSGLTKDVSDVSNKEQTSADISASLADNRDGSPKGSIVEKFDLKGLQAIKDSNGYLKTIVENDFANFPFGDNAEIVMLLSSNGAAYTAAIPSIYVEANSRMLISFWVKTSKIRTGGTGAGAILMDGKTPNAINSFDSNSAPKVNVNSDTKDIWDGWVQCFFFVENDSDVVKSFTLNLTYGPTKIEGTSRSNYSDGYAAFANFEVYDLSRSQYSYAATGTYARKVTLSAVDFEHTPFDNAAASGNKLEDGLARPANYTGSIAGSKILVKDGVKNPTTEELNEMGIYTGLLSKEYADNYADTTKNASAWKDFLSKEAKGATDGKTWWKNLFGTNGTSVNPAYQPLVLLNTSNKSLPSYGFYAAKASVAAFTSTRISVRLKVSANATAYLYLIDASGTASEGFNSGLKGKLPPVTFWYDDNGNIVNMDPSSKEFDKEGKILYRLQDNGLYKNEQDESDTKFYANLANFDRDDDGNYTTTHGTPVFYLNPEDKLVYAEREEAKDGSYTYSTVVEAIPTEGAHVRYAFDSYPEAVISVSGKEYAEDEWVTVYFYVETGKEAKDYRIELWAGQRDYVEGKEMDGFAAESYVFFDRYSVTTDSIEATANAMLAYKNDAGEHIFRDKDDAKKIAAEFSRYYTFTFYDSADYIRYNAENDKDGDGNPWRNYEQSKQSEKLVYLLISDPMGEILETTFPTVRLYMSFAQSELDVEAAPSLNAGSNSGNNNNQDHDHDHSNAGNDGNIWLYLASALLFVALIFAVVAIIVRKLWKKRKKTAKVKAPAKQRAPKAQKSKPEVVKEEPAAAPQEVPDENNPYNE